MHAYSKRVLPTGIVAIGLLGSLVTLAQTPQVTPQGMLLAGGIFIFFAVIGGMLLLGFSITEDIKNASKNIDLTHEGINDLRAEINALQSEIGGLKAGIHSGRYRFIEHETEAFEALIEATSRGKLHVRSTRFSPFSLKQRQPRYANAIYQRVVGADGNPPLQHYSRIVAANNIGKLDDVKDYIRNFHNKPFTFYLTTQENSFEIVIIDDAEVFVHFHGEDAIIDSTLHIPDKEPAKKFRDVFDRLHKRHLYPDVRKFDCSQINEGDIEGKIKEAEMYFTLALSGAANPNPQINERHPQA
jgi:hypothetical protein